MRRSLRPSGGILPGIASTVRASARPFGVLVSLLSILITGPGIRTFEAIRHGQDQNPETVVFARAGVSTQSQSLAGVIVAAEQLPHEVNPLTELWVPETDPPQPAD